MLTCSYIMCCTNHVSSLCAVFGISNQFDYIPFPKLPGNPIKYFFKSQPFFFFFPWTFLWSSGYLTFLYHDFSKKILNFSECLGFMLHFPIKPHLCASSFYLSFFFFSNIQTKTLLPVNRKSTVNLSFIGNLIWWTHTCSYQSFSPASIKQDKKE